MAETLDLGEVIDPVGQQGRAEHRDIRAGH